MIDNNQDDFKDFNELINHNEKLISQDKNKLLKELIKNKNITQESNQTKEVEKETTIKKKWYITLFNILR